MEGHGQKKTRDLCVEHALGRGMDGVGSGSFAGRAATRKQIDIQLKLDYIKICWLWCGALQVPWMCEKF